MGKKVKNERMKAESKREATEAFRVATECGCGLTKGSKSPLATEVNQTGLSSSEREQARTKFKSDKMILVLLSVLGLQRM